MAATKQILGLEGSAMQRSTTPAGAHCAAQAENPARRGIDSPEFHRRLREGEPTALQTVVRAYLRQVFLAARSAGLDKQQAEEATQSTFLTFVEKAGGFQGRSTVRTWLFGILYRKIAEVRRKQRKRDAEEDLDQVAESRFDLSGSWMRSARPIEAALYRKETVELLNDCLKNAPARQRSAFLLREVEALAPYEVCQRLGVTPTNLWALISRVRNRLRDCLKSKGVDSALIRPG